MTDLDNAVVPQKGWFTVCGSVDAEVEERVGGLVHSRVAEGKISSDRLAWMRKVSLAPVAGKLHTSDARLEKLRQLCQVWDVDLRQMRITSHRPIVGPIIVLVKRGLFALLRVFMKDLLRQQRDFNAQCVALFAELANERAPAPTPSQIDRTIS